MNYNSDVGIFYCIFTVPLLYKKNYKLPKCLENCQFCLKLTSLSQLASIAKKLIMINDLSDLEVLNEGEFVIKSLKFCDIKIW